MEKKHIKTVRISVENHKLLAVYSRMHGMTIEEGLDHFVEVYLSRPVKMSRKAFFEEEAKNFEE